MKRRPGLSVRLKLTISYTAFIMLAGALLLVALWLFATYPTIGAYLGLSPNRYFILRSLAPAAAIVLAFLLIFGLIGGWILAGRLLNPLTKITAATRRAANGSLSHRIELEGRNDEFHELADAFDGMLERLEAQVTEQRRFAANASHELRTPLAVTQTLLDVARKDPDRDNAELLERLRIINSRAIDLTEALLLLSRVEQGTFIREQIDLSLIAEEAAESLLPLAEKHGVTIETSGDVAPTSGSHSLLLQMTSNLVHNAIVHNLPEHGTVQVNTAVDPKSVVLTVENTGDPLSPQLVSTLTEPFQRGTERIRSDHAGVGLGLAIVKSIAQVHDKGILAAAAGSSRGRDHDHVAVLVRQALGLDVPRLVEELLDEALAPAEGRDGLAHGRVVGVGHLAHLAGHLEAATTAAERRLDRDRQAVLLRELSRPRRRCPAGPSPGRQRSAHLLGDVPGPDLVAQGLDRLGGGPIQVSPASITAFANSAFSARNP